MTKKPPNIKINYIYNKCEEISNPQNINNLYEIYWSIEEKDDYLILIGSELSHINNVSKPLIPHEEGWTSSPDNQFYFYCKLDNQGLPHGDCSIYSKYNNEVYAHGKYKHGLLDGFWILCSMGCSIDPWEIGQIKFKNGKLHGPIEIYEPQECYLSGNYCEGKEHGLFQFSVYKQIEMSDEEWDRLDELWEEDPRYFDELYETKIYEVNYENGKLIEE